MAANINIDSGEANSTFRYQFDTFDEAIMFIVKMNQVSEDTYVVARTTMGKFIVFLFLNGVWKMPPDSQFIGYFNLIQQYKASHTA